jgi:hypothetical protein
MFKIFAVICFLNIGTLDQTLCFKSNVPVLFNDSKECNYALDNIADYMDYDLKERKTTIVFKCSSDWSNTNA